MRLYLLCYLLIALSSASVIRESAKSEKELPVCIIGAGLAGLGAASELEKAGVPYAVFEGAARIGGRVYPFKHEDGYLQYGGAYINGNNNSLYEIASAHGLVDLDTTKIADDYVPIYTEEELIQGCDVREFAAFTDSFATKFKYLSKNGHEQESFQDAFDRDYAAFIERKNRESRRSHFDILARMYVTDWETEWAALMKQYALSNYENHVLYAEGRIEHTLTKQGFHKILEVIKSGIPDNKINFGAEVKNIDYSNKESVTLTTAKGKHSCSQAIVTVSLGYLKKHSPTLFTPELPEMKKAVIKELGFGDMQKVFLEYDKPWLDRHAYHTMSPASVPIFGRGLSFDVTPWSRNTIQFWFSAAAVRAIGEMSDEKLNDAITEHLTKTMKNFTVPQAKRVMRQMWYQDPLVLGSYSYLTPAAVALKQPNLKLAEPILGNNGRLLVQFAGEATVDRYYQTTTGAYISGQREAKRVIEKGAKATADSGKTVKPSSKKSPK